MTAILLRAGTVLSHEGDSVRVLRDHDVLIIGNTIAAIGQGLSLPNDRLDGRIIDCRGKIVSPGFIDTHHHLWQSQLRGRFGNLGFMDYMVAGNLQSFNYTPEDISGGNWQAKEAIRASASSGLRIVFCYTPIWRIKSWSSDAPIEFENELLPEWWYATLEELARSAPFGDARVTLALGFDDFNLPKETVQDLWARCRALGISLFTTHFVAHFMKNSITLLKDYSLLDSTTLFSHLNGIAPSDKDTLLAHGAHFSSTPETELQMGLGEPVAFTPDPELRSRASIGIDCHANNSADILTQLRLGMQHARGVENTAALAAAAYPRLRIKLEEVFNLGTIQGARAIGMGDILGSVEVGKRADIVVFDAESPAMACAGEESPLAAVVLHANVGDLCTVIVDGVVRKERARVGDVRVLGRGDGGEGEGEVLSQKQVLEQLLASRERIIERGKEQDPQRGMEFLHRTFA
ncbi:hypothetical protein BDW62DRAFT_206133 [Aspergillus aurantiobrunneus]